MIHQWEATEPVRTLPPCDKKSTDGVSPSEVCLPNLDLIDCLHELRLPLRLSSTEQKELARQRLMQHIIRDEMLPFYLQAAQEFHWSVDEDLVKRLTEANENDLKALDAALVDAEDNFGDIEVKDCLLSKANFLCRIGDIDGCIVAYEKAREKTVGSGGRLDVLLRLIRLFILFRRKESAQKTIALAQLDCEKGGDWERRNKLKIFSAIFMAQNRKFNEAIQPLLECIPIFSASDLIDFESFIFITVILSLVCLERPTLVTKIVDDPKVFQVLQTDPELKLLLNSYVQCHYSEFMRALIPIYKRVEKNFYLQKHARFFLRSVRVNAYRQFLQPFSSVSLESMASSFGVSQSFIELDVADYIANGKLVCKIDRVNRRIVHEACGQIESWHVKALKQGDTLLAKIQKLSKIIDM